jgi:periplasmic protein TonB
VSAASAPRLSGGIVASVLLHGGLVAAFIALRPPPAPPSPPVYRVQLFAAPPGPRAVGVVQEPQPAPVTPAPTPPATKAIPPVQKTVPSKTRPKPSVAKAATPTPPAKAAEPPKPATPAPTAGGGPTGGKGADVAAVETPGIDFPYPGYTNNIVRQLILQFGQSSARLTVEVRFVIRRDGSVDPESIRRVTSSGDYSFDNRALAAVEAAANAKAFGPLPAGFREDILPVTFRFSPSLIR